MTGARRWPYKNKVNSVKKVGRRLRPRTPWTWHEKDATQIDTEFGHGDDAGVIDAHHGGPVTVGAGFTQEAEGETESAETDGGLHDYGRPST